MRKLLCVLQAVVTAWIILTQPGLAQQENILLKADRLTYFDSLALIIAEQGVEIYFEEMIVRTEKVKLNLDTAEIEAEQDIRLDFHSHCMTGRALTFNFKQNTGSLEQPAGVVGPILFQAKSASFSPKKISAQEGSVTTCEHSSPHYHIQAKRIELYPGEKIVVRNATFYLGSVPIFWSPVYTYYFIKRNKLRLPQIGFNEQNGWYIKTSYLFYPFENTEAIAYLDYYERMGLAGGFDILYSSNKDEANLSLYAIRNSDTETFNGLVKLQGIIELSPKYLLKLNLDYRSTHDFFYDSRYRWQDEKEQIFPSFFALDFKERNWGILLKAQKKINLTDEYPEFLPRIRLSSLSPAPFLQGLYIKQNTELTNFIEDAGNVLRLYSSVDFSYPATIFDYIRFKPALRWDFFLYNPKNEQFPSGSTHYQSYEFFSSLKGKRKDLDHNLYSTFGYYYSEKSGPDFPHLDNQETDFKPENILHWKLENEFFLRNSPLFFLDVNFSYDLALTQEKLKPMHVDFRMPFAQSSLYADFSYDFYKQVFPYFRGGVHLKQEKWELDTSYSNYSGEGEFVSAATSFEVTNNLSLFGKINYNLALENIENLSYGLDAKLHCMGVRFNIQEKPEIDWNISLYITAFPF